MSSASDLEKAHHDSNRSAVKLRGIPLFILSFQTLGIIYSDIGTSPLYVLNGLWPSAGSVPSKEDVIGGISAILWSLILLPMVKYIFTSFYFGTAEGEGGTFALFQGLFPPVRRDYDADRTLTGDSQTETLSEHSGRRHIWEGLRWPFLTMADGVFTPAVSVTSAVAGIGVAKQNILKDIIPISIVLLLALFLVQRFGTSRVAFTFAPISFLWFLLIGGCGIYNITFFPGIFRAFDPSRAVLLFVRTGNYDLLAGVLLAVTGCEATFANLGQFNAASIRISFITIVFPSLALAYLGQGARLIHDGEAVLSNMFYNTIPGPADGGLFWVVFVFAILATIIASQAMISATFSLTQQLINQKSFPPIRMVYTSETMQGQIYVPAMNWVLMIATIVIVGAFSNLANMTNAYGFAVATVMFSTTVLISTQIFYVKNRPLILSLCYFLFFGFFDALFWGAALKKVPHGAWVPLTIGLVLLLIMWLWTWAKGLEDEFDGANRQNLRHFIHQGAKSTAVNLKVQPEFSSDTDSDSVLYYVPGLRDNTDPGKFAELEKRELQRIPTCAVFHKVAEGRGVPHSFIGLVRQWPALPRVVIFLSVSIVNVARVPKEERYVVSKVRSVEGSLFTTIIALYLNSATGFYGVTYYLGFRDDFDVKIGELVDSICELERLVHPTGNTALIQEIRSVSQTTTHIVPRYHVISRKISAGPRILSIVFNWCRKYLIEEIYRRAATMFPETGNWLTSEDEIIRVGITAVI
ncbi:hypothetical protein H0H93_012435 [Arthromyces matolae]|nr:hypothetical protein H0H93_012435 [Arthromyces matolae]